MIIYFLRCFGKSLFVYNVIFFLGDWIVFFWIDCYGVLIKKEFVEKIVFEFLKYLKF